MVNWEHDDVLTYEMAGNGNQNLESKMNMWCCYISIEFISKLQDPYKVVSCLQQEYLLLKATWFPL